MIPPFVPAEFESRAGRLRLAMRDAGLDAMLLFAQESMYWLTGYNTFGFCFFQCLVVPVEGEPTLLTRAPDLRQAQLTSNIRDIRVWCDSASAKPARDLRDILDGKGLAGGRIGIERDTHGLTAAAGLAVDAALAGFGEVTECSQLVPRLRLVKSEAELVCARRAGVLADAALDAALPLIGPGRKEGEILAAMQGAVFAGGGDYPANPYILGSGAGALLCRSYTGRRALTDDDQLTLEWAGTWRLYHAARMATVVIGKPRAEHRTMHRAARDALLACEEELKPGRSFGDVFAAHARVFDEAGLRSHRLNACGYSLGARFAPSWMDGFMFYESNPEPVAPGMVLFLHMILADSDTGTAMSLGRTSVITADGPEPINGRDDLSMMVV